MKYNLGEQFASKTDIQLKRLIKGRLVKNEAAHTFIRDNDNWPLNEVARVQAQLRKANAIGDDCTSWLDDAVHYVSECFWNSIIEDLGWCYEGNCHSDMLNN